MRFNSPAREVPHVAVWSVTQENPCLFIKYHRECSRRDEIAELVTGEGQDRIARFLLGYQRTPQHGAAAFCGYGEASTRWDSQYSRRRSTKHPGGCSNDDNKQEPEQRARCRFRSGHADLKWDHGGLESILQQSDRVLTVRNVRVIGQCQSALRLAGWLFDRLFLSENLFAAAIPFDFDRPLCRNVLPFVPEHAPFDAGREPSSHPSRVEGQVIVGAQTDHRDSAADGIQGAVR